MFLKKKKIIFNNYFKLIKNFKQIKNNTQKMTIFTVFNPKKQLMYSFKLKHLMNKKQITSGSLLSKINKKIKFFKKKIKNLGISVLKLKKITNNSFDSIYLFNIKNYGLKINLFWKKLNYLINVNLQILLISHSWNTFTKKRRRVKRSVWRKLLSERL